MNAAQLDENLILRMAGGINALSVSCISRRRGLSTGLPCPF